jgi:hypothetical protein
LFWLAGQSDSFGGRHSEEKFAAIATFEFLSETVWHTLWRGYLSGEWKTTSLLYLFNFLMLYLQ